MMGTRFRALCAAVSIVVLAILGLAAGASAKLTGEFKRFEDCPYDNAEVNRCIYTTTAGGEVVLGSKKVPIVNPVVLQGGYGEIGSDLFATKFFVPKKGVALSKASQPVPGGLMGIVPPDDSSPLVKTIVALLFEAGLMGVSSTLELAKPASEIRISENHLAEQELVALELPIKIHLENPLLGSECYVGSSSKPIVWKLTTGTTAPPKPSRPISGTSGELSLLEDGGALLLEGAELVDNSWAAPSANGCGGMLSFLVNPMVNRFAGLPEVAGKNVVVLENTVYEAPRAQIKTNDEEHP